MKSIYLGYVPVQFTDSSSRGYGGSSSYGSPSVGSSYRGYDYPSLSTLSSYGVGTSYDNYRAPTASDRTLNYLSTSGAVSSLKDKFDLSPSSSSGIRGSSGYASSSLDRYTGRLGSDYSTGKFGSGYSSDVDVGLGSQSYGNSYSGRSSAGLSTYTPSSSLSSRTSRPEYSRSSSRDFGTSYGLGSGSAGQSGGSDASRAKSSYYSLTPFETRRTAKTSDLNLTPFTSRASESTGSSNLTKPTPSYDRQTSSSSNDKSLSRQTSYEDSRTKRKTTVVSDSSDSAEEPSDISKRDPNVRYLTSRATSPLEIDRDAFETRKLEKNRNRLISRTKTKTYPVGDRKRRRQLKNIHVQVDGEDLDKFCGRVRINRDKLSKYSAENKYGIPRYGPSVAAMASSLDDKSSRTPTAAEQSSSGGGGADVSMRSEDKKETLPSLPKQSGFVPRDRKMTRNSFRDDDDSNYVPANIRRSDSGKNKDRKEDEERDPVPKQSSFLERKWQQQEEAEKQQKTKPTQKTQKDNKAAGPENLTLKESIEKVKHWKQQLQSTTPDSPEEDEHLEIYGKDE